MAVKIINIPCVKHFQWMHFCTDGDSTTDNKKEYVFMYVAYAGCVTHDYAFKINMHKHLRTYIMLYVGITHDSWCIQNVSPKLL